MKRTLLRASAVIALSVAAASCADSTIEAGGTAQTNQTTQTSPTTSPESAKLNEARTLWASNKPESYRFTYALVCECETGPWEIESGPDGPTSVKYLGTQAAQDASHTSIEDIFDEIAKLISDQRYPVEVTYDQEFGYPLTFTFNEPELATDGGFVLRVESFDPLIQIGDPASLAALNDARAKWADAALDNYDYTFTGSCFCPREYTGPFAASVRGGQITAASFEGTDLLELATVRIQTYDEVIKTVDGIFAEIERAALEADSLRVTYHPELGYPVNVVIDWDKMMADEESGYTISELTPVEG